MSEHDPHGKKKFEPGAKLDAGKAPVWQGLFDYFPRACMSVADLSAYGASKYSWKGWEKVPDGENRYGNAVGRHILKEAIEGLYDLDAANDPDYPATVLHATQQAWNAMARLELMLRRFEREQETYADPDPAPVVEFSGAADTFAGFGDLPTRDDYPR